MDRFDDFPSTPLPGDPVAADFWAGLQQSELKIQACADCGDLSHPPRPICCRCASWNRTSRTLSGHGVLVDFDHIFDTFDPFLDGRVMFRRVVVELVEQDGLRLVTKLVEQKVVAPYPGLRVRAEFPRTSGGERVLVFRSM